VSYLVLLPGFFFLVFTRKRQILVSGKGTKINEHYKLVEGKRVTGTRRREKGEGRQKRGESIMSYTLSYELYANSKT
jgi:hypothetical protein